MSVLVEIPQELRSLAGGAAEVQGEGMSLGDVLREIGTVHPALQRRLLGSDGSLAPDVDVLRNGRDMRLLGGCAAPSIRGERLVVRLRAPARLTGQSVERYSRQLILPEIGPEGQDRLRKARIAVIGAGGLGSPALMYLAAAGVGRLVVIDGDRVDRSNLHRQPIHRDADVGVSKAESARRFLEELNPQVEVTAVDRFLSSENAMTLLEGMDLVVSGADNFPTRYLVSDACVLLGIPLVDASILRFEGRLSVYLPGLGCYRCLFPSPPPPGSVPSCAEAGVIGALAGQFGTMQALEAVKLVTGAGTSLAGRLLVYDALAAETKSFRIRRDPACPVCGDRPTQHGLVDYEAFCGVPREQTAPQASEIDVEEAAVLLRRREVLFVDVRPLGPVEKPTLPGAVRLPLEAIEAGELPSGAQSLVVFCEIGRRSSVAAQVLAETGIPVHSLRGGMVAWRAAGLPLGE